MSTVLQSLRWYCDGIATCFAGALPEAWASPGAFKNVQLMDLSDTQISGSIPPAWSDATAFPNLVLLDLNHTLLTGSLPAFHNGQLQVLIGNNCSFDGNLSALWTSSAPLTALMLGGNNLSGKLPVNATGFPNLAFLDLAANQLEGRVPIEWLQPGNFLSHITVLALGTLWEASQTSTWKQTLCLQSGLYEAHVVADDLDPIQDPLKRISDIPSFDSDIAAYYTPLSELFANSDSQVKTVGDLCQNHHATEILLIMWLIFAVVVAIVLAAYESLRYRKRRLAGKQSDSSAFMQKLFGSAVVNYIKGLGASLHDAFAGFVQLALYYYDLISALVVLSRVHNKWPGYVLFVIFFLHFALIGAIVVYRALSARLTILQHCPHGGRCLGRLVISMLASPFMIPVILTLDTIALAKEAVVVVVKVVARLFGMSNRAQGFLLNYMHSDRLARAYVKLSWIHLKNYERMHNSVAALFQTVPVIILNSIVFALGNKPTNGLFFSRKLFVSCMIASYLAMLKALLVVIWHAYFKGQHAFVYAGNVMTGSFITADAVGANNELGRSASSQVLVSGPRSSMDPESFVHGTAPSMDSDTVLKISRLPTFTREPSIELPRWGSFKL